MFSGKKKTNKNVPTSFSSTEVITTPKISPKEAAQPVGSVTLIARDTEIMGDIKLSGNLEIEGRVVGNISAKDPSSKPNLRVLENGSVEGDILVGQANINGYIKGNVQADNVDLAAKAKILGNVYYKTLEMTKGAQVNGNLVFADSKEVAVVEEKNINHSNKNNKSKSDK